MPDRFQVTLSAALIASVASLLTVCYAAAPEQSPTNWVSVSDATLRQLTAEGKKTDWPGETAGVAVDPSNGDVYMIVAGQGVWKSVDQAKTFARSDGGKVGGRCETAYSLNMDPAGKRLACFMLDGKCAWTGDSGRTWQSFKDVGRNWDFAAVDWSTTEVKNIFAGLHESGGQVMYSNDGGKNWSLLFKDPEFDKSGGVGIFDEKTLVYTQRGKGIQRSTDAGRTWTKVSDLVPIGRVVRNVKGTAYWLGKDGLLVSSDKGASWKVQGKPVEASIGPVFDPKNEKHVVVAGVKGIYRTTDGGETWTMVTTLPAGADIPKAGWYSNVAWDPVHDDFYLSKMGKPMYRFAAAKQPNATSETKQNGGAPRILLVASEPDHPWASHMYEHECKLLGKCLENTAGVQCASSVGWPKDPKQLEGVKAIVFYCKHAGDILLDPVNREQCLRLLNGGAGLTAVHWSTGADQRYGPEYLDLLGGWFNTAHSGLSTGNSWLTQADRKHPITHGWKEWEIHDEFYLNLRFAKQTKPLLTVKVNGIEQVVGWTLERAGGGRSFGTTLGHFHDNFARDDFRRLLVNGILWTAHVEVPAAGADVTVSDEFVKLPPKPATVK